MKTGKILQASVALMVFNTIIGMVCCGGVFNWVYKLEPVSVWKPMGENGPAPLYYLAALAVTVVFVCVYALLKNGLPGKTKVLKGLSFGLCAWGLGIFPGMVATYFFMNVATPVVVYWLLLGLVQKPVEGAIAALIYGD